MAYKIQTSFSAGEISPLLHRRNDDEYKKLNDQGLAKMVNCYPTSQGPVVRRNGMEAIDSNMGDILSESTFVFIYPFYYQVFSSFVIVFTGTEIRIYNAVIDSNPVFIINFVFDSDVQLSVEMIPNKPAMVVCSSKFAPKQLTYDVDAGTWTFFEILFEEDPGNPIDWLIGEPELVTFYGGRMVLARSEGRRNTLMLSKPLDYYNFDFGSGDKEDDALELEINNSGSIEWIMGNRQLFVGMDTGEHIIYGTDGPIWSANAKTDRQSTYGSAHIKPEIVNGETVFINKSGSRVLSAMYLENSRNLVATDLAYYSKHFFNGSIFITQDDIIDFAYTRDPDDTLFFVTREGNLFSCNVEKDRGFYGWSKHVVQGYVKSVTVASDKGVDTLYILVATTFDNTNPVGELKLCRYNKSLKVFVDYWLTGTLKPSDPDYTFSGFLPLKVYQEAAAIPGNTDYSFYVIGDDTLYENMVIDENGYIVLPVRHDFVYAGLSFKTEFETLPEMDDVQAGSMIAHVKHYSKLYLSLFESARPFLNGMDLYQRFPLSPMQESEKIRTEILEVPELGLSRNATIKVEQELPYPLIVNAIGGKLKSNKL